MEETTVHVCYNCKHHKTELNLSRHLDICLALKPKIDLVSGYKLFPRCADVRAVQDHSKTCKWYEPKENKGDA